MILRDCVPTFRQIEAFHSVMADEFASLAREHGEGLADAMTMRAPVDGAAR